MKNSKYIMMDTTILRQKAEELLQNKKLDLSSLIDVSDILKVLHELEVHQIELEMQNEELILAKEKAERAEEKYTELYDFATSGYITISKTGTILELNFAAARMLGKERLNLINSSFAFFVQKETRTIFNNFLDNLLKSKEKQNCEIAIASEGALPIYVSIDGITSPDNEKRFLTLNDITARIDAKKALQESEDSFMSFFENAGVGIYRTSPDGKIIFANPTIVRLLGYNSFEELSKITVDDNYLESGQRKRFREIVEEKGSVSGMEYAWKRIDGDILYVRESARLVRNDDGTIRYFEGMVEDITEQKRSQEMLIESERRYRTLTENSVDAIMRFDSELRHIYVNPIVALQSGIPREVFLGKTCREMGFPLELVTLWEKTLRLVFETGITKRIEFMLPNGVWIDQVCIPEHDENNNVVAVISSSRDISERKKAEEALKESETLFSTFMENLPVAIYIKDMYGRNIYFNKYLNDFLGIIKPENKFNNELVPENVATRVSDDDKKALEKGLHELEETMKDCAGNYRTFATIKFPIKVSENNLMLGGISVDITALKNNEAEIQYQNAELIELNNSKDKFFSIIAHDLKSPLAGFLGLTKLMAEDIHGFSTEEKQEVLTSMNESATNLYKLLENLLEWAKMQRGLTEFKPEILQLASIAEQILSIQTVIAKAKKIALVNNIPEDVRVTADISMLNSIFRNIISNAIKFTPTGGIVEIGVSSKWRGAEMDTSLETTIYVKDSGIGMDSFMIDLLFKLDKNVSRLGTNNEPSTGLGLLLCKEFIEKHGGNIWVESEVDKGTTFCFTLPTGKP